MFTLLITDAILVGFLYVWNQPGSQPAKDILFKAEIKRIFLFLFFPRFSLLLIVPCINCSITKSISVFSVPFYPSVIVFM